MSLRIVGALHLTDGAVTDEEAGMCPQDDPTLFAGVASALAVVSCLLILVAWAVSDLSHPEAALFVLPAAAGVWVGVSAWVAWLLAVWVAWASPSAGRGARLHTWALVLVAAALLVLPGLGWSLSEFLGAGP